MPENVQPGLETPLSSHRKVRLFSGPLSMFGAKVQIAAHEKNIDFELVMVPFTRAKAFGSPAHQPEAAGPRAGRR